MIELVEVTKRYRLGDGSTLTAADSVTATFGVGQTVAITGPSGCGKSTLLHLVGAIDTADSGQITVDGRRVTGASQRELADYRRGVGLVFQRFHLIPALTVVDNVAAPLMARGRAAHARERCLAALASVGLADRASSLPGQLSGGQQQRVAIARALVVEPALILADEPTGNLDSATAEEVADLMFAVQRERQITMLLATHDPTLAQRCKREVTLRDGAIVTDDLANESAGTPA